MRCATCANTYSPPTGWRLSEAAALCGPCAIEFGRWVRMQQERALHRGEDHTDRRRRRRERKAGER